LRLVVSFLYDCIVLGVPRRTKGFMKRFTVLVGVLGVLALFAPSAALAAGNSTCQGYSSQTSCLPTTTTTTTSAGTLPFTGLDVVLLVAGGGTLLAAGFVVRRLSRRLN
jgi:multisubunit Na+/H+ antiporter MnhB subunit